MQYTSKLSPSIFLNTLFSVFTGPQRRRWHVKMDHCIELKNMTPVHVPERPEIFLERDLHSATWSNPVKQPDMDAITYAGKHCN